MNIWKKLDLGVRCRASSHMQWRTIWILISHLTVTTKRNIFKNIEFEKIVSYELFC